MTTNDAVAHPKHYTQEDGVECIDFARHLDYCRGAAFKYVWRHEHKGKPVEDLDKAIQYLEFAFENGSKPIRDTGKLDAFEAWWMGQHGKFDAGSQSNLLYLIFASSNLAGVIEYAQRLRNKVAEREGVELIEVGE